MRIVFSILYIVKKSYVAVVVFFAILLLLPFSVQFVTDVRTEKRFLCFDIFKDIVYTPFVRELNIKKASDTLEVRWRAAREAIAAGDDATDALEPVVGALNDLESVVLTVNSFAALDSSDEAFARLKRADSLLSGLEDEPENFLSTDSCIKSIVSDIGPFSLVRAFLGVKRYGAWSRHYLRAFEKKVEDENALVLAARPRYQRAVWNIFGDPGEKVVLGDEWLFYRQDVEFLVQPSPLDVRSANLDNPVEAILRFRDQLKAKGVELLVVVSPGKPSIYPERLVGGLPVSGDLALANLGHGKRILDSLNSLGLNTVDLYAPLLTAKSEDEKLGALYLNDDTHWTPRGAEIAAAVISAKVREMVQAGLVDIGEDSVEYVVMDSVADRMGDIGEMSGLNKFNVFKVQQVTGHVVSQQNITERVVPREAPSAAKDSLSMDSANVAVQDSVVFDTVRVPFKDDFRKAKILILGDSFSRIYQTDSPVNAGWIAHFAKNIKRPVASIVSDGGASTLVREKLARKAGVIKGKKLLIWEFVERDLRFGAEGWKTIDF